MDLTIRVLQDIREDIRGLREDQRGFAKEVVTRFAAMDARFETIETALRDLTQQLVILGRGVKVAIDTRAKNEERLDEHERRIAELEKRLAT